MNNKELQFIAGLLGGLIGVGVLVRLNRGHKTARVINKEIRNVKRELKHVNKNVYVMNVVGKA